MKIGNNVLAPLLAFIMIIFVLSFFSPASNEIQVQKKVEAGDYPIWKITIAGTDESVKWEDYRPNKRFAIYDGDTEDFFDDVVLDKETGLVWARSPGVGWVKWQAAVTGGYTKKLGGRLGWRLPTMEELSSLLDPTQSDPALPNGHPFINVQMTTPYGDTGFYWTATTFPLNPDVVYGVTFKTAWIYSTMGKNTDGYAWYVRGGHGHDHF